MNIGKVSPEELQSSGVDRRHQRFLLKAGFLTPLHHLCLKLGELRQTNLLASMRSMSRELWTEFCIRRWCIRDVAYSWRTPQSSPPHFSTEIRVPHRKTSTEKPSPKCFTTDKDLRRRQISYRKQTKTHTHTHAHTTM